MLVYYSLCFFFMCWCHVMLNNNIVDWDVELGGFVTSMLDSRQRGLGSSSGWGHCVIF